MKKLIIAALSGIFIISCNSKNVETTQSDNGNFDYLIGDWKRTNEAEGKSTFEHWTKINDTTYHSKGYTLQGLDTVWQENVVLSPIKKVWYFQVHLKEQEPTTDFKVIEIGKERFTCENQDNDFPKIIKYWKKDQTLLAEIKGGETKIPYVFEKL